MNEKCLLIKNNWYRTDLADQTTKILRLWLTWLFSLVTSGFKHKKVPFQRQTETINPWVNNLLLSHCYPICPRQMGICLFFLSVEERTATNWRYPRIVDFWLQSHIIGALLVFKVTERQASASYIRKPFASLEWNIWLLVGAPAVSRKSWEASSWQTGSRRRMGQRWREWVRIIGPFLPFSDSGQYFCHGFPSYCVWHFASALINPHATLRNKLICTASAIWLNTKCLSELCQHHCGDFAWLSRE